jgi:hypothetical protein
MLPPADVSHATAYLLQKSAHHAADGARAEDEVIGILALIHAWRLQLKI